MSGALAFTPAKKATPIATMERMEKNRPKELLISQNIFFKKVLGISIQWHLRPLDSY